MFCHSVGCDTPDNAIGYAMHSSRSHDAVIRAYDAACNVIETPEQRAISDSAEFHEIKLTAKSCTPLQFHERSQFFICRGRSEHRADPVGKGVIRRFGSVTAKVLRCIGGTRRERATEMP
jgi:hypothetical protein